jgi:hypothetical protein
MPSKSSITKPVKVGVPALFDSCLPPQIRDANSASPKLNLQFGRNGKLTTFSCDRELFERVDGAIRPDGPHTGFDNLRDHHFVVWSQDGVATSVDRINMRLVSMPQKDSIDPDKPAAKILCELDVDTGEVFLHTVPNGVKGTHMLTLVQKLGAAKSIKRNAEIIPGYSVTGIDENGNLEISWPRGGLRT